MSDSTEPTLSEKDGFASSAAPAAPAAPSPADFPDGGLKAWSVVAGAFCCLFASFGWISCIGVFQDYYQTHQLAAYSPSTVAWISSTETFMMFAGAPAFGKIFDNFGPRWLLAFGTLCHVFGIMMASLATRYYHFFLAQSVCSALGASALFYAGTNPIGTWFFKRRALAFGIISSGSSLSGVVLPIMIEHLLPRVGFGWTMRVCAFLFLGLLAVANVSVKSRLKPKRTPLGLHEFLVPFKERRFLMTTLGSFFFFWGVFLPMNFLILQARHNGMSLDLAGYLLAILNATSVFGRILPGYLGDRFGRYNIMIAMTLATSVFVLALWIPGKANAPILVFTALFGFTSGTFVSMTPALIAQITDDMRKVGVRSGSNFFVISLAALTGNPIAGALIVRDNGGYLYLQVFCGITMLLGCSFFVAARYVQCGWQAKRI